MNFEVEKPGLKITAQTVFENNVLFYFVRQRTIHLTTTFNVALKKEAELLHYITTRVRLNDLSSFVISRSDIPILTTWLSEKEGQTQMAVDCAARIVGQIDAEIEALTQFPNFLDGEITTIPLVYDDPRNR